jgi:PAS domain S-box-containing protein
MVQLAAGDPTSASPEPYASSDARGRVLARALAGLAASLDYADTLERVASAAVPALADYCLFDLLGPDGRLQRVGWSHVDPVVLAEVAPTILAAAPDTADVDHPTVRALQQDEIILEDDLGHDWMARIARNEAHLAVLQRLAPRSVLFVPLRVAAAPVGVLVLAVSGDRRYGPEDVELARDVGARAGEALERAALHREIADQKRILEAQGEAALDGMLVVSPEGRIVSSNRRFAELLGLPPELVAAGDDEAALAAAQAQMLYPERFLARVRELYDDPDAVARDRVELSDGRLLERHTSPVRDEHGRLIGRLWSFRDVTEQLRAEDALRYQSDLTRTILENAQFGVILMDECGCPTYANEAWTHITGFTLADMRDRPAHESVHHHHPDGRPFPIEDCPIDRALPERRTVVPYEDMFIRKDGSFFPVRAAASPILREGVPVGTVVEMQDITEERRIEAALREAQAAELDRAGRLTALIETMREAVVLVEADGRVSLANREARALFGDAVTSLDAAARSLGTSLAAFERAPDGSVPAITVRLPDEDRWMEIRGYGTDAPDAGDERAPAIFLFRDVTEQQRAHLLRDTFVEVLSHELRTPVTTIYGGSRLLARGSLSPERVRDMSADIVTEADRLYRLIENLVVMTKAREQALDVHREPVLLHRLIARSVASEQESWPDVRVAVRAVADVPPVAGDGTSIEQVVRNLLGNAAKYGRGRVQVLVEAGPGEVLVRVLDNGPGIPPDALGRIFDLFYRAPEATQRASGAGIGLFVCRHLIEAMGGRIWAANRPEGGAELGFALPQAVEG